MAHKYKLFGAALIAALALSAMVASAAQAVPQFTAEEYPATLEGAQIGGFAFTGKYSVTCGQGAYGGELTGPSSTLTLAAQYSECTTKVGETLASATVTMNGCDFLFHLTEKVTEDRYKGPYDIVCPEGKQIEMHTYSTVAHTTSICTLKIPAQTGLGPAVFINITGGEEKEDEIPEKAEGVRYSSTGILCGGTTEANNGVIEGFVLFQGTNQFGVPIGLAVSG